MTGIYLLSQTQIKLLVKLKQKKYRYQLKKYICEGYRCLVTALENGHSVQEVIVTESLLETGTSRQIINFSKQYGFPVFAVDDRGLKKISDEKSPSGILFTSQLRQNRYDRLLHDPEAILIYLDKISDPGNLGTLIRTASWFNIKTVLLSPNSVDPYNPKTVRSSAGSIFVSDIYRDVPFRKVKDDFKALGYHFIATTPKNGITLNRWQIPRRTLLLFGQEAEGLSQNIVQSADTRITIEGSARVESLNISVAAGIIIHYLTNNEV